MFPVHTPEVAPTLVLPSINTVTFAEGAWEVRSRSEEEAMQRHRLPPPALISPPKPRLQTLQYLCSSVLRTRR